MNNLSGNKPAGSHEKKHLRQDFYLNYIRKEHIPVAVYLVNGIKLQGFIDAYDEYVVLLRNNMVTQMVYKHAISTVSPSRPMTIDFATVESEAQRTAVSECRRTTANATATASTA